MNDLLENRRKLLADTKMRQFTFYLDDVTKVLCLDRLQKMSLDTQKGTLSSLIRVLLGAFADGTIQFDDIRERVEAEYTFTTKKNKRGTR